ncbi:magnetosome protein MamA [Fundidesulfovibrio magnetotacticus]|uniref:Magnetosome protein MamA n=2 Tax=Fundidesulfovibrio magnetotacticus TaxID=2730080 RepID=A0A6V8LKS6_9BACT|nr:magnetosome protein MamA [Fundidesulfovibrio magnetotacticus]
MLNWYNSIFSLTPKDKAKMYRNLSRRAIVAGEPSEAIRYLKEWAKNDRTDVEPVYQMGVALSMMGDYARATGAFDKVLKLRPNHVMAAYRKSAVLLKLKKFPEAAENLERVVEAMADDARAYYLLGLAYEGMGNLEKGVAAMSKAVELDPEEIKYHQHLGFMNVRRDDHKTAAEHFTKVMELEREHNGEES